MYLSRLSLAEDAVRQPELWRTFTSTYTVHQAVWRLFPHAAGQPRDFLYRIDTSDGRPQVWTLSPRPPQASPLWRRESKEIAPRLAAGDRLELSARVNPVVTRAKKRHDVVMDLKQRIGWKDLPEEKRPAEAELVQQAVGEWLAARAAKAGFAIRSLRADGYRQDRFGRPGQSGKEIGLGVCDLSAQVEVKDPEAFLATWRQGLGPAKGFGCGLILLRRSAA